MTDPRRRAGDSGRDPPKAGRRLADCAFERDRARPRRLASDELTESEVRAIRSLLQAAFGTNEDERFTEDDWAHALGGVHFVLDLDREIVAHAAVVEREIHVGSRPLRTGYVEAVATAPRHQARGFGTRIMRDVDRYIRERFELGVLGTGAHRFYERLGWRTWAGPSYVRVPRGLEPTPDADGYILVLTTRSTPPFDPGTAISCDWRPGDVW